MTVKLNMTIQSERDSQKEIVRQKQLNRDSQIEIVRYRQIDRATVVRQRQLNRDRQTGNLD